MNRKWRWPFGVAGASSASLMGIGLHTSGAAGRWMEFAAWVIMFALFIFTGLLTSR